MIINQAKIELKKTITLPQIILWILLISLLPIIKFYLIIEDYVYYRQLDLFLRVNSDFVPLLFALLMVIAYSPRFLKEQKNNYFTYISARIPLPDYLRAKLIVNAFIAFILAFLVVFLPFLFVMYIEPSLNIVHLSEYDGNPIPYTTFEQFLPLGTLAYGLIYSIWVGVNGMLYATFGMLLLMIIEKPLISLSFPVIYYLVGNFITGIFGYFEFSPTNTIFPFAVAQQPLWTVLIPFGVLLLIVFILYYKLKRRMSSSYE